MKNKIIFLILALFCANKSFAMNNNAQLNKNNKSNPIINPKPENLTEGVIYLPESTNKENITNYNTKIQDFLQKQSFIISTFSLFQFDYTNIEAENKSKTCHILVIFLDKNSPKKKSIQLALKSNTMNANENKNIYPELKHIVLYLVKPSECDYFKEFIENSDKIILKNLSNIIENQACKLSTFNDFNYYNFELSDFESDNDIKLTFDTYMLKTINLLREDEDQKNINYYLKLAKTTNNKKLFRNIFNTHYLIKLIKNIPTSHSDGQCATLPDELACQIMSYATIDSKKMYKKENFLEKTSRFLLKIINK